jgi:hypothetical protein
MDTSSMFFSQRIDDEGETIARSTFIDVTRPFLALYNRE